MSMKRREHARGDNEGDDSAALQTEYVDLQVLIQEKLSTEPLNGPIDGLWPLRPNAPSLWSQDTLAVPMTYIITGLLLSFPSAYIDYFPRTLSATDAQLSTISVVRSLPWSFKVLFGFLPDRFPIHSQRFRPYMFLGYSISTFFYLVLGLHAQSLSVVSFTLLLAGSMVGIVMADVMGDAYVAHLVLKQHEAYPGQVQSIVYMCRFLSEMVGYWCGALLSNQSNWGVGLSMRELFFFLALLPIFTVVPCIVKLREDTYASHDVPPLRSQLDSLWLMLQRRATWQSVCFLAFFNALLLRNSAWGNYLTVAYHFNAFEYGSMSAIGSSVTFLAIYLYRHYIMLAFENPWHQVYIITGCVVAAFSLLNVLLVFKGNEVLGIPAFWFAVGDSAVISFAKGFQYLPLAIIFVAVCPPNQEGVAFALLTSVTNLAHAFAYTISNMMLRIWPVELTDLKQGHFNGVWKLTLLTSLVALFPLLFIGKLLPRGKGELEAMKAELSVYGARFVALLYVVGFIWVMLLSLLAIVRPCHVLVGGHGCAD